MSGSARFQGAAVAQATAATAGLVTTKNNFKAEGKSSVAAAMGRGAVAVDQHARRCKRMRTAVEHSMRLSEARLSRSGGFRWRRIFVTLTYADVGRWSREHVSDYLRLASLWAKRKGFRLSYCWVAELQERGALHYHVSMWVPARLRMPAPDKCGWWRFGSSNVKTIKGGCAGVMAYMSKYMSKTTPGEAVKYPKGARMHGAGGLEREEKREIRYRQAPGWVRDALGTYADIRKALGGWCDRITGDFLRSPWAVRVDSAGLVLAYRVA